jgi:hypothetical protein
LIIARGSSADHRQLLLLGLSRVNVNKLVSGHPIRLRKATHENIPEDLELLIVFCETEADLARLLTNPGEAAAAPAGTKKPPPSGEVC